MGSSLETAIVCTLVILVIAFMITKPEDICVDALRSASEGIEEIAFMTEDSSVAGFREIGNVMTSDCSAERFHTYIAGLSDSYRIVYSAVSDAFGTGGD
ncbi:hypothetical protein SAMN02910456_00218 [Ruminococcaceae bacterium YRB3002]|nr:hypothetical protein SAMN02910456_00218 [Ruminococcaceae bacterium YRB3002]